jgi:1D-myo-inositol-tetrakisphosphate 5-kinase/inositol-polyphosphate multikinase
LEDLTFGLKTPCIMDIKIGSRLYDVDASPRKIERRVRKSETTTSGALGFRLCGLKVRVKSYDY